MDASEQIKRFEEFLDINYKSEILQNVQSDKSFLIIDFNELLKFDPNLAEELLEQPEEIIKAAELAVENFDLQDIDRFKVRFNNIPNSQKVRIRDIRAKHLGIFVSLEGLVRQKSDVRPQVVASQFECPSCGNIINVLQVDTKFKEPSRCGCGRKGKFRLMKKELVDAQRIVLEESPENLEGSEQPKRISVFLKQDLVSPISEKKTNPGSKIQVIGIIREVPIVLRTGGTSTRYDLVFDSNFVVALEEDFTEINISKEDEEKIKTLAQDPKIFDKFLQSVAPSIYGHDRVKEALILQLFSGVQKERTDGVVTRGDIHVLLIGDPGAGKSQLLRRIQVIAPKGMYVSGKGATGVGLTASVVKDEFMRGYALEAGALVLANKGICCIDELDKMSSEDRSAMHEALEQQTVTVSKANIQATLLAKTTVLAAANPKFGRFDPYEMLAKQIELPPTLINRFDLIFPIRDLPDEKKDNKMASFILNIHKNLEAVQPAIDTELIKKYIAYSKQNTRPVLSSAALEEIKKYYVDLRNKGSSEEEVIRSIPISPRQLEALVRLSESSAKIRLAKKVTKADAKKAISLLHYCLTKVGVDKETGKIDIDRIATGVGATQRSKIIIVREIITDMENKGIKTIPIEDILREAEEKGISESDVEESIEKLKRSGDLFEPRRGYIQKI
ncbi:MAG: Minichromosome maintenance protein MCM [Candidatus Woesearchaeota archaeon]|nr:Minichromosome maintenance protein MCM [Candidatus Woesearchaeota archaeon]